MRLSRALSALPFLGACYTYAPLDPGGLRPGMTVRARVSAGMAQQLQPLLATTDARLLNGTIIGAGDTLVMEVPSVTQAEVGSSLQTLYQRVSVPRTALLEIETRTLDRFRTGVAAGAAAVIVGGYVLRTTVLGRGKEPLPGGGGPAELRIPLIRIRP